MLGHRGVRLGITYPEVSEMQIRAILEAAGELIKEGKKAFPEIMIPVTCAVTELEHQKKIVDKVYAEVCKKLGLKKIPFMYGTMIEIPRAALTGRQNGRDRRVLLVRHQRPDADELRLFARRHRELPARLPDEQDPSRPTRSRPSTRTAWASLSAWASSAAASTKPNLKVGICGEHGGDPDSVKFCHQVGMNYVSCSPFRVPIARLAAAQAAVEEKRRGKEAGSEKGRNEEGFETCPKKSGEKSSRDKSCEKGG